MSPTGSLTLQQALDEAHRCLLCHDAPCSSACPGGTDPGKFIRQIRFLNLKGAARTVLQNNPLGGVCAYVCPTEDTCTGACLRSGLDRPIDIDGLQRFAVEYGRQLGLQANQRGESRPGKIAIVGAGPAGLVTAAHLSTLGYDVTIFEAKDKPGGMLRYGVPPARLPEAALDADIDEILQLGVTLKSNTPIDGDDGAAKLLEEGYDAVLVATGLWKPYELDLPGKDLDGVANAIQFLGCVHTDPDRATAVVKGKNVAIIGGGSVALDVAQCARELGAGRIYAIALEGMTELPANEKELGQARRDGVVIKPQCQVTHILGEDGAVVGVEGVETEWIEPGKLVPNNARVIVGTSFKLRVGAVVQAIGQGPTDTVVKIISAVEKRGRFIRTDENTGATSVDRIYAGGDIVRGAATIVEAVGDGRRVANAIHQLLSGSKEVQR